MEKLPKHDGGRGPTGSASSISANTIPPTRQTASKPSNVHRATTDPSAPTATAIAGRSARHRNKLSSTSSSISQAHFAVPPEKSKCSSSSSRTSSSRSEAAQPVARSHGGQLSTTASASSRPEDEPISSKNIDQATSHSGGPQTDGLTREDRKARRGEASSVEGSRPLPATLERASHESRPVETNVECSAEKSSRTGTNLSEPRYREPPIGIELRTNVGAPPPSMAQLQHSTTNRVSILETVSFMHRSDTAVPGPAVASERNRLSSAAVNSKRKLQTALGTGTGATGLTPNIQDLLKLKRPSLKKQSPWPGLHAFLVEKALQHRRSFVSVVLLCTAAGSLLLGLLIFGIFGGDDPSAVVCGNYDCVDHVAALSLTHNDDIAGPCKNFAQFVCSGVKNKYSSLAENVVSQRVLDYTARIIMQRMNNSIFSRPSKMIRRCLDENSRDDATLKTVMEFLQDKSFAWPTPNDTKAFPDTDTKNYSQPLKILLDLAVTWSVPMWFRCDLLLLHEGSDRAVRLVPSPMGRVAKQYHELVLGYNSYASYVEFVASILFSLREPTPAFASFVRRSKNMQEDIYNNLSFVFTSSIYDPKKFPLRKMPSFVRQLTGNDWQRVLRSVFNVHPPISSDDVVFVTNHRLLVTMRTLFEAYTPQEIAFHTMWWFAQVACILTSRVAFNAISTVQLGWHVHTAYCTALARGFYTVLLAAASKADTSIQDQMRIKNWLENIKTTAVDKLEFMTRIENLTKDALQTMLMDSETIIWPNGSLSSPDGLERHYGPAYNGTGRYFSEMIATARFQHHFIGTYEASVADKIFFPRGARLTSYDPAQNVISVATDLLGPPFYYPRGTSAMIYGGLGFLYAMEVVIALSSMSVLIRDYLTAASTKPSTPSLWVPSTCKNHDLLFPELPALALAHAAYLRFRDADSDLPLKGLIYSPEQIFFISFCHATCLFYPNTSHFSPVCNEVVKNFVPFASAFSCPEGSEMNPATKCQYL